MTENVRHTFHSDLGFHTFIHQRQTWFANSEHEQSQHFNCD